MEVPPLLMLPWGLNTLVNPLSRWPGEGLLERLKLYNSIVVNCISFKLYDTLACGCVTVVLSVFAHPYCFLSFSGYASV